MASLANIVYDTAQVNDPPADDDAYQNGHATSETSRDHPTSPRPPSLKLVFKNPLPLDLDSGGLKSTPKTVPDSRHSYYGSPSLTPAARTGPPRSLSYNYTIPSSFSSHSYDNHNNGDILEEPRQPCVFTDNGIRDDPSAYDLTPRETQFRGPLDTILPEQRDGEREAADRRVKRKETSRWDDFKSRWLPDTHTGSPSEETSVVDWGKERERNNAHSNARPLSRRVSSAVASGSGSSPGLVRSVSMSTQDKSKERERQDTQTQESKSPSMGWSRLRFLLPRLVSPTLKERVPSTVTPRGVNITDELIVGGLSVLMLRLWFERDERDRRRVPVLLHRLRIRISDSIHPLHGAHSVFRIECEYANGAMRWVIYRQLRDFLSLHAHYAVSNAYNRNIENLPEFPRTSRSLSTSVFVYEVLDDCRYSLL